MALDLRGTLALALDPTQILRAQGRQPDPWQENLLLSTERQVLLNCLRQSGKSTTVAALALHTALFRPGSLTLLLSPSLRQSLELFRKVAEGYSAVGRPVRAVGDSQTKLELANRSRVVCLPGNEETVRSFSDPALIVIDEAARVPDDLYRSVRPMLAVSRGRLICLSTPFGKRGFFWQEWDAGGADWHRVTTTWQDCPRITPAFIDAERRSLGESWVRQEYECSFEALEGLVYPDFEQRAGWISTGEGVAGQKVGGIDWGFRNPFAAVWGVLDRDDVLWLYGERYVRETPLHEHAASIPRACTWYADPSGATEIAHLRTAGFTVRRGTNDIRAGIAAVTARIQTRRLRVYIPGCPNLLAEAKLYHYPRAAAGNQVTETPVDESNHALGALRYLVSRIDARFIARLRRQEGRHAEPIEQEPDLAETLASVYRVRPAPRPRPGPPLDLKDESLWTPLN